MEPAITAEVEDILDDIALNEGLLASLTENPDDDDSEVEESRKITRDTLKKLRKRLRARQHPAAVKDESHQPAAVSDEDISDTHNHIAQPHNRPGSGSSHRSALNRSDYLRPPPNYNLMSRKRQRDDFDANCDLPESSKSRRTTPSSALTAAPSPAPSSDSFESLDDPFLDSLFGTVSKEEVQRERDYWKKREEQKEQEVKDAEIAQRLSQELAENEVQQPSVVARPSDYTQAFFKTDGTISRRPAFQDLDQGDHTSPTIKFDPATNTRSFAFVKPETASTSQPVASVRLDPRSSAVYIPPLNSSASSSRPPVKLEPTQPSTTGLSHIKPEPGSDSSQVMPGAFPGAQPFASIGGSSVYNLMPYSSATSALGGIPHSMGLQSGLHLPSFGDLAVPDPYAYARSEYHDPVQTQEEVKQLLKHIRPDEELTADVMPEQPRGLKVKLMPHQLSGLAWMRRMEEGTNKGGVLADDMGLGKTIQAIALMLERPPPENRHRPTLVVAPVSLMHQWRREIEKMVRSRHRLNVFVLHGETRKSTWASLRAYDVILTTYGLLASELKRQLAFEEKLKMVPDARPSLPEECPILGGKSRFHRVVLDEAQNIKNRLAKAAIAACRIQADHRWALSGTPMQNGVEEMFSLIKFCRIRPYNEWEQFRKVISGPLKTRNGNKTKAMATLQALLRAILLRRTKTSEIHGKPILQLPPKETKEERVLFDPDELKFYKALETNAQLQFNKFLRRGAIGQNYSKALVLLLRLRQACCHPRLVTNSKDFFQVAGELDSDHLVENAARLNPKVVDRLKEEEAFECPICMDVEQNPTLFECGHALCSDCLSRLIDQATNDNSARPNCPHCRAEIDAAKITDRDSFLRVHCPDREGVQPLDADNGDSDSETDSNDSSDDPDEHDDLKGFIVPDDFEEASDSENKQQKASRTPKKGKRKSKSRDKFKDPDAFKSLADLRKESLRNKTAKRKYLKRLRKNFHPSAKINKAIELLERIRSRGENEKTIIFSNFTTFLDLLEVPLYDHRDFCNYTRYDGSMSSAERNDAVLEFTDNPNCTIILVSLKAGNSGLNLVAANHVVILDPFWNPFVEYQAADRCHRIGQLREVTVHRVLIGEEGCENNIPGPAGFTVEDRILRLQDQKRELVETALDESAARNVSRLGTRELGYLFGLNDL